MKSCIIEIMPVRNTFSNKNPYKWIMKMLKMQFFKNVDIITSSVKFFAKLMNPLLNLHIFMAYKVFFGFTMIFEA